MRWLIGLSAFLLAITILLPCAAAEPALAPWPARTVAFSPDGQRLALGSGAKETAGAVTIWELVPGSELETNVLKTLPQERGVSSLAYSPDGKLLAMSLYDASPTLLDASTFATHKTFEADRRGPVAFSPDGGTFACGCEDRSIRLFDLAAGMERTPLAAHGDRLYTLDYSPDGKRLVSVGRDGIRIWDLATSQAVHRMGHGSSLTSCGILLPGGFALTGGWDGSAKLWNAETGDLRGRIHGVGSVDRLAYSPATGLAAICTHGREVLLFDLAIRAPSADETQQIAALVAQLAEDDFAAREAASQELAKLGFVAEPELRRASTEHSSAEVRIRARLARKALYTQPLATLDHPERAWCVAFSPGGKLLATGADDGSVHLWDVANRQQLAVLPPAAPPAGVP